MTFKINWDNGCGACGTFPEVFKTEAEAETFATNWARERNLEDLGMTDAQVDELGGDGCYTAEVIESDDDEFPETCTACGNIHGLCICEPLLFKVTDALVLKGYDATYEYPGYIGLLMPNGHAACFGDSNVDYTANWEDGSMDDQAIDFFMPAASTMEELVAAIEGWITTQVLSDRAAEILKAVKAAMQPAEELHGPDDYVPLMEAIAFEANQRIATYRANHGGVK